MGQAELSERDARLGDGIEGGRQLRRPYFETAGRRCSRMSTLYRSIWPASLAQLGEISQNFGFSSALR
jgi:hypothetical protein